MIYKIFKSKYWLAVIFLLPTCLFAQNDELEASELEELIIPANNVKEDLLEIFATSEKDFSHKNQQLTFGYQLSTGGEFLENIIATFRFKNLGARIFDPQLKWSDKIKYYGSENNFKNIRGTIFLSLFIDCSVMVESDFNRAIKKLITKGIVEKNANTYKVYHPSKPEMYVLIKTFETSKLIAEVEAFGLPLFENDFYDINDEKTYFKTTFSDKDGYYLENIDVKGSYVYKNVLFNTVFIAKKDDSARNTFIKKKTALGFITYYTNKKNEFLYEIENYD